MPLFSLSPVHKGAPIDFTDLRQEIDKYPEQLTWCGTSPGKQFAFVLVDLPTDDEQETYLQAFCAQHSAWEWHRESERASSEECSETNRDSGSPVLSLAKPLDQTA